MFENIELVYITIWAMILGVACAVIYINIYRNAISKFVLYLIENKAYGTENEKNLKEMGLSALQKRIVLGAMKSQMGLKRIINVSEKELSLDSSDDVKVFGKNKEYYFSLNELDEKETVKKHSYNKLPIYLIPVILVILVFVGFASCFGIYVLDKIDFKKDDKEIVQVDDPQNSTQPSEPQEVQPSGDDISNPYYMPGQPVEYGY